MKQEIVNPVKPADVKINPWPFSATETRIEPVSDKGREFFAATFGEGCVGVTMLVSRVADFGVHCIRSGIEIR